MKTKNLRQSIIKVSLLLAVLCLRNEGALATEKSKEKMKKKILFVVTSHDKKGSTNEPTGFYLSEVAHPWHDLVKAGYEIDFVSPKGGRAPVDGFNLEDEINKEFWNDDIYRHKIEHTMKPTEVKATDYVAIHYAGGHGAMWDFADNPELASIAATIYKNGGIISAVCHGPAGLANIKLPNGTYLVDGKKINAFTNDEEATVKLDNIVPFLLESSLIERGALFEKSDPFQPHVVVDNRVITGQNPQSAKELGEVMLEQLRRGEGDELVGLITRIEAKSGHQQAISRQIRKYVRRAAQEKSNIMIEGYYEEEAEATMWVIERWDDMEALERYRERRKNRITVAFAGEKMVQPVKECYVKDLEPLSKVEWWRTPKDHDKSITIMLFVNCIEGTEGNFKEVYHNAMPQFRGEPGVVNYQLSQFLDDETQFVTYEKFRDEDAFQFHLAFPPIQPVLDYLNTSIKQQPFQRGLHRLIMFAPVKQK